MESVNSSDENKKELKFCEYEAFRMAGEQVDKAMQEFHEMMQGYFQGVHPDDIAVDKFAAMMKAKLAKSREKGRSGWDDPKECSVEFLAKLLAGHVQKGDPVDVANFAMMLTLRGASNEVLAEAMKEVLMREYWRGRDDARRS